MTTAIYLCPLLDSPRPTADSLRLRLEDLEKTIAQLRPCSRLLVVLQQPQLASMHARRERAASWRSLEYLLNAFYTVSFEFIRSHHGSPIGPQVDIVVDGTCGYDPLLNTGVTDGVFVNRSLLSSSDGERLSRVAAGSGYQLHDLAVARSPAVQSAVSHMLTQSFEAFCKQTEIHVEIPAALMARQLPTAHQSVVLGGTFDHFHAGHKILLTMACWLSVDSVICGISSDALLRNKKHRDLMESFDQRRQSVQQFCGIVARQINFQAGAINDMYGPTATDPSFEAIVVSMESLSGGRAVNAKRAENGLQPLYIYVIDLLSGLRWSAASGRTTGDREKLGSTEIREWINHSRSNSTQSIQ